MKDNPIRITQFESDRDYTPWCLRVVAMIRAKGWEQKLETKKAASDAASGSNVTKETTRTSGQDEQAGNEIVSALGDHAFHVVRSAAIRPSKIKKLDAR